MIAILDERTSLSWEFLEDDTVMEIVEQVAAKVARHHPSSLTCDDLKQEAYIILAGKWEGEYRDRLEGGRLDHFHRALWGDLVNVNEREARIFRTTNSYEQEVLNW